MLNPSKQRLAFGLVLTALSLLLASCGSSGQNQQGREALRFNPTLPQGYIDDRYEYALVADGGQRPYRYTLNGTLPKGLTYSGGRISGVPTEKGQFELNATVEDGNLSSRAVKLTLTVSDTPPPQFDQFVPNSEQDSPFVYGLRIRARESRGFQMQVPLTDLRPTLDTLKAADGVLYVLRYNQERNLMDIDVAFTQPRTNFEAYRLSLAPLPDKKVRFAVGSVLMALYDKNGKLVANFQPMERQTSEGRYKYEDLQTLARNWGKGVTPEAPPAGQAPAGQTTPPAQTPTTQSTPTEPTAPTAEGQSTTPSAQNQTAPTPEQPAAPAQTETTPPTQPAQGQPEQSTQGQPTQPAQGQPTQPAQGQPEPPTGQPVQPEQAPPTSAEQAPANPSTQTSATQPQPPATAEQPAQGQPNPPAQAASTQSGTPADSAKTTQGATGQGLEGDLNNDGKVDSKDLEALRASYAWANVGNPTPRAPQNPQTNPNPNQPGTGTGGTGTSGTGK